MNRAKESSRSPIGNMPCLLPIFSTVFLGFGLFAIITFGQLTILKCDRSNPPMTMLQGTCQLVATRLLDSKTTEIPLNELRQATIATRTDSKRKRTYQVILQTQRGEVPFTFYSSSGLGDHNAIAHQINAFLKNSQQRTLLVRQDDRWFGYLVGGVFTLVGLIPWVIAVLSVLRRR